MHPFSLIITILPYKRRLHYLRVTEISSETFQLHSIPDVKQRYFMCLYFFNDHMSQMRDHHHVALCWIWDFSNLKLCISVLTYCNCVYYHQLGQKLKRNTWNTSQAFRLVSVNQYTILRGTHGNTWCYMRIFYFMHAPTTRRKSLTRTSGCRKSAHFSYTY
jgi:hypothetical protein